MASSLSFFPFSPRAQSRNPNPNPKQRRTSSTPRTPPPPPPTPLISYAAGGEATTYTKLPPREDFSLPSSFDYSEVSLSESRLAISQRNGLGSRIKEKNGELGFDLEKFELFEVGSDSEEEYEDDDDVEVEEYGGDVVVGFGGEESGGEEEEEEEVKEKEKGVPAVMRCFDR